VQIVHPLPLEVLGNDAVLGGLDLRRCSVCMHRRCILLPHAILGGSAAAAFAAASPLQ